MIQTECGIFATLHKKKVNCQNVINGLKKLQHRGRESFGISFISDIYNTNLKINEPNNNNEPIKTIKNDGLVKDIDCDKLSYSWLGHVRYSTAGKKIITKKMNELDNINSTHYDLFMKSCQPLISYSTHLGHYSLTHNGNIPHPIWIKIKDKYPTFVKELDNNTSDTLLLIALINHIAKIYYNIAGYDYNDNHNCEDNFTLWSNVLEHIMKEIPGAYCLVIQTQYYFLIVRDKFGIRPLSLCLEYDNYFNNNIINSISISSENCAFNKSPSSPSSNSSNVIEWRDVKPGEIISINLKTLNIKTLFKMDKINIKHCVFEYIYFLRDNTIADNTLVKNFRHILGNKLSQQFTSSKSLIDKWKQNNALVCGVPSSGINFGLGFANSLGLEYSQFLKKRADYPWRTFILGSNDKRLEACRKKFIVEGDDIKDKIIILIDDSIVRGNTVSYLIKYIKQFNPSEIHFISGSPPIKYPCNYGVDFPDIEELIANRIPVEKLSDHYEIDSLTYLDFEKLMDTKNNVCNACFTGNYMF